MWKATVKGILARKVRLALTAVAVLLGVSFVSGIYVLTDTLDQSFRGLFRQLGSGVDLVVRHEAPFGGDTGRERFPEEIVDAVRTVDGVATANGVLQDYAQFVAPDGESIQTGGAPTIGLSWSQEGRRGPLRLVPDSDERGRPPRGRHEVAMDAGTAREHDFHVGDQVRVLLEGPAEEFEIVGLFTFGDQREIGAITAAAFDLETAQEVFDAEGSVDAVNVTAEPGVSGRRLRAAIQEVLGPVYDVQTARQVSDDRGEDVLRFLDLLTQLLLGFAAIGLVIGAFIIFNTFTILVAQRTHEFGLLRAMGATGRQVVVTVVVEAAVVGALASAAGLALGYGFAAGLLALGRAIGRAVPDSSLVLSDRTVIVSLAVGTGVTVASSLWPAIRAARVPPVAAITDVGPVRDRPFRWRLLVGALLVAGGVPALVIGLDRARSSFDVVNEIWLVALGALLLFFGVVVLLAAFARPLAGVLGLPLRVVDASGALARRNAMRNPRRTAATASALVIGLALVGLVSIFGASAKASVGATVNQGIRADFVLKAQQFATFSEQVGERLRPLDELAAVASFRFGNTRVDGQEEVVAGVAASQLGPVVDLDLRSGAIGAMAGDGVLVHRDAAEEYGVRTGDRLTIQFPRGFQTLDVAGVYDQENFVTGGFPVDFVVARRAYEAGFGPDEQEVLVYVKAAGDPRAARVAIEDALGRDFPNIEVLSRSQYRSDQEDQIEQFLTVTVALLLLSELIAVLGIVNTLALSVFERTHELGLLRAVGMTRRQVRRMVRSESALIALVGGLVGIAMGLLWGWALTSALETQGVTELRIPGGDLAAFVVLSMLAGVAAALAPAWRASRLDVLAAITTE